MSGDRRPRRGRDVRGRHAGAPARAAARLDREAHDGRRSLRRVPLGGRGLVHQRRADVRAHESTRCARSRSRSPTRSTTTSSSTPGRSPSAIGTDHHEVVIDWDDLQAFLPEMIYHQDEPIADWVCVPLYYVAKLARDSGTIVVQVGEGSDELFHGYDGYINAARFRRRFWEPFQRVPAPLRRGTGRAVTSLARRVGRGEVHALQVSEAAAGRLPFWGGAICYQGVIKERVLARNGRRPPDSYDDRRALLGRGRGRAAGRRPAAEDDLSGAQEPPRRAAADAGRQDDDGDLGGGARAVPRPRAGRVRDGAAARR